ncbi:hypothetical protein K438DRAFT_1750336 [Mycena galopus ATCC 62051]|nr:hypothetical protein K438DRAFT_1750336 [Mycena galopus ATCC 62051]
MKEDGSREPQKTRAKSGGGTRGLESKARARKWSIRNMYWYRCWCPLDEERWACYSERDAEGADAGCTQGIRCGGDELRAGSEACGIKKKGEEKRLRRGRPAPDYIEIQAGGTIRAVWEAAYFWEEQIRDA